MNRESFKIAKTQQNLLVIATTSASKRTLHFYFKVIKFLNVTHITHSPEYSVSFLLSLLKMLDVLGRVQLKVLVSLSFFTSINVNT